MSASPNQVSLSASAAAVVAAPVGQGNDTMTSVQLWTALTDLYLSMVASSDPNEGTATPVPQTGFLMRANTIMFLTLKPYETLYGYTGTGGTVYVLRYVNEHARSS